MSLRLCSWNAKALLSSHHSLQELVRRRMDTWVRLCLSNDIVVVQETHGNMMDQHRLEVLVPSHFHYLNVIEGRCAGGLLMSVSHRFMSQFASVFVSLVIEGRVSRMVCSSRQGNLEIMGVHIDPAAEVGQARAALYRLKRASDRCPSTLSMFVGDFNAHPTDEPRYCGATRELKVFDSRFTNLYDSIYSDFADISGNYFTYRSAAGSLSRLDRCLCSLPTVDLMDRRPTSHTTVDIANGEWISDHAPVIFLAVFVWLSTDP